MNDFLYSTLKFPDSGQKASKICKKLDFSLKDYFAL